MAKKINNMTMGQVEKELLYIGKYYTGGRRIDTFQNLKTEMDEFRDVDLVSTEGQPKHLRIIMDLFDFMRSQAIGYTLQDMFNIYGRED